METTKSRRITRAGPTLPVVRDVADLHIAFDGDLLPADHGGPLRVVTPHRYAYEGVK